MEFLMKTVCFSEPVMSGLSFPRTIRSSSTGHQDCISHTVMYLAGLSVGIQRPDWGPWPEKNRISQKCLDFRIMYSGAIYMKLFISEGLVS